MRTSLLLLLICGCVEHDGEYYYGGDMATHNFRLDNIEAKIAKPGCHVTMSANQTLVPTIAALLNLDTEAYDHGDCWNTTSKRYTAKQGGIYSLFCSASILHVIDQDYMCLYADINGVRKHTTEHYAAVYNDGSFVLSMPARLLAVGDYVEFQIEYFGAADKTLSNGLPTYAMIQLIEQ